MVTVRIEAGTIPGFGGEILDGDQEMRVFLRVIHFIFWGCQEEGFEDRELHFRKARESRHEDLC